MIVRELELDLDAFEGPFDLLLALVLKEELDLRDVDLAGIVTAFLERLAEQSGILDGVVRLRRHGGERRRAQPDEARLPQPLREPQRRLLR
ncbi:MAG: hypothetical protein ACXVRG_12715, partial [Gaiellaceae bacterium]